MSLNIECQKTYVEVVAHHSTEGKITPLQIILETGERYAVDRVTERRMAPSPGCGGFGMRYTCMISGKPHFLWQDDMAFYVDMTRSN